jgi:hypothetical protein
MAKEDRKAKKKIVTIVVSILIVLLITLAVFNLVKPKIIPQTYESPIGEACYSVGQSLSIDNKLSCYNPLTKEVKLKLDFKGIAESLSGIVIRAWSAKNYDFLIYNQSFIQDVRMIAGNYNETLELPLPNNIYVINLSAVENVSRISVGVIARWARLETVCDLVANLEIKECPPECSVDSDCVKVQTTCCSCGNGGNEICVPKNDASYYQEKLKQCSPNQICPRMMGSCVVYGCSCVNGKCAPK